MRQARRPRRQCRRWGNFSPLRPLPRRPILPNRPSPKPQVIQRWAPRKPQAIRRQTRSISGCRFSFDSWRQSRCKYIILLSIFPKNPANSMRPGASVNRFSNRMVNFDARCIFFQTHLSEIVIPECFYREYAFKTSKTRSPIRALGDDKTRALGDDKTREFGRAIPSPGDFLQSYSLPG